MPNPNKVHRTNLNKADFNYLFFAYIFIAVVINTYLMWKDVQAGLIYLTMFLSISVLMGLIFFWVKDDAHMGPITHFVKIPIASKLTLAVLFDLVGFATPILLKIILTLSSSSFSVTSLSVPLFGAGINKAFQSFSTAEIGNTMSWKLFSMVYDAGTIETYVYNFGLVLTGVMVALLIVLLISKIADNNINKKSKAKFWFVIIFSTLIQPVLLFILSHVMNKTYKFKEFIMAGLFLMFANVTIYFFGSFLLFWTGYHQANNLMYLIEVDGLAAVFGGFISIFGLFFLLIKGLEIFFVLNNWDLVRKDLFQWKSK